jgi:hypothetical protein
LHDFFLFSPLHASLIGWHVVPCQPTQLATTFIYEPIRWNERFGWRLLCEQERLAMFYFWRQVGRRMNLKELPTDYACFERYNVEYEKNHFRFTEANYRVGAATRDLFASWFPPYGHWSEAVSMRF